VEAQEVVPIQTGFERARLYRLRKYSIRREAGGSTISAKIKTQFAIFVFDWERSRPQ
jgi:hypothetical protein